MSRRIVGSLETPLGTWFNGVIEARHIEGSMVVIPQSSSVFEVTNALYDFTLENGAYQFSVIGPLSDTSTDIDRVKIGLGNVNDGDPIDVLTLIGLSEPLVNPIEDIIKLTGLPSGGSTGQHLTKVSGTDYDAGWTSVEVSEAPIDGTPYARQGGVWVSDPQVTLGGGGGDTTSETLNLSGQTLTVNQVTIATDGAMISTDKIKLDTVESGATLNSPDAALLARANHTGTQTASTISDFDTEVANNTDVALNTTHSNGSGSDHSDVALNTTHRTSDGSDHTFINQSVTTTADTTFSSVTAGSSTFQADALSGPILTLNSANGLRTATINAPSDNDSTQPFTFSTNNSFSFETDGNQNYSISSDGNNIFNGGATDADFVIRKQGSGTAYAYNAGTQVHTFDGVLSSDDVTDSTSIVTGSIHTDGGLGVAKTGYFGTGINVTGDITANSLPTSRPVSDFDVWNEDGRLTIGDSPDSVLKDWTTITGPVIPSTELTEGLTLPNLDGISVEFEMVGDAGIDGRRGKIIIKDDEEQVPDAKNFSATTISTANPQAAFTNDMLDVLDYLGYTSSVDFYTSTSGSVEIRKSKAPASGNSYSLIGKSEGMMNGTSGAFATSTTHLSSFRYDNEESTKIFFEDDSTLVSEFRYRIVGSASLDVLLESYFRRNEGTTDYATIPEVTLAGDFVIEFDVLATGALFHQVIAGTDSTINITALDAIVIRIAGASITSTGTITRNAINKIIITRVGLNTSISVNGVVSNHVPPAGDFPLDTLCARNNFGTNSPLAGILANLKIYDAGTLVRYYKLDDNSDTLVDTVSGQNGTVINGNADDWGLFQKQSTGEWLGQELVVSLYGRLPFQ